MSIDSRQLRKLVVDPTLSNLNLYSESASDLIMGTIAQESNMGTYIKQLGEGPALGICQMEPNTYIDICDHYLSFRNDLRANLYNTIGWFQDYEPPKGWLIFNLAFAVAMCRIHYLRVPEPLPRYGDIMGYAEYWKKHYNTHLGKGTVDEFINNYKRYVDI